MHVMVVFKEIFKKLGKVLFLNLYQNFMHWILKMSEILNTINSLNKACVSWYEHHASAA